MIIHNNMVRPWCNIDPPNQAEKLQPMERIGGVVRLTDVVELFQLPIAIKPIKQNM